MNLIKQKKTSKEKRLMANLLINFSSFRQDEDGVNWFTASLECAAVKVAALDRTALEIYLKSQESMENNQI